MSILQNMQKMSMIQLYIFFFFSMAQEAQKLLDSIRLQLQTKVMQASIASAEEARMTLQK